MLHNKSINMQLFDSFVNIFLKSLIYNINHSSFSIQGCITRPAAKSMSFI